MNYEERERPVTEEIPAGEPNSGAVATENPDSAAYVLSEENTFSDEDIIDLEIITEEEELPRGVAEFYARTLWEYWNDGFAAYISIALFLYAGLLFAGYFVCRFVPGLGQQTAAVYGSFTEMMGLTQQSGIVLLLVLFLGKLAFSAGTFLLGFIPFIPIGTLLALLQAWVLGAFAAYCGEVGAGLRFYITGIIPHGIFEIPAQILALAAGLHLYCTMTEKVVTGGRTGAITHTMHNGLKVIGILIVPLLLLAVLMECFGTSRLLAQMLP